MSKTEPFIQFRDITFFNGQIILRLSVFVYICKQASIFKLNIWMRFRFEQMVYIQYKWVSVHVCTYIQIVFDKAKPHNWVCLWSKVTMWPLNQTEEDQSAENTHTDTFAHTLVGFPCLWGPSIEVFFFFCLFRSSFCMICKLVSSQGQKCPQGQGFWILQSLWGHFVPIT